MADAPEQPGPEDALAFIEGANTVLEAITVYRDGLIEREWSLAGAEAAATMLFSVVATATGKNS